MKDYLLPISKGCLRTFLAVMVCWLPVVASGQVEVVLEVDHVLGDEPFGFGQRASTNMGMDFELSRLEYYISEVTVIHDGGQQTTSDYHVLVDAGQDVQYPLGMMDVSEVESIRFGLGVDTAHNHDDPALFPCS